MTDCGAQRPQPHSQASIPPGHITQSQAFTAMPQMISSAQPPMMAQPPENTSNTAQAASNIPQMSSPMPQNVMSGTPAMTFFTSPMTSTIAHTMQSSNSQSQSADGLSFTGSIVSVSSPDYQCIIFH